MKSRFREWRPALGNMAIIWGILAVGIGLYAGTLWYAPVWDDHNFVFGDAFLMECRNLGAVLDPKHFFWVLPVKNAARPVWMSSVLADSCLYGGVVAGYRMSSILLHAAGGVMMLALAWRLSASRLLSVLAALLFVAHPLHTESVNIITFRTDILCFLFMVPSLLAFLESRERRGGERAALLGCSALFYLLAMMSKEMAVVLPGLMFTADRLFPAGKGPRTAASGAARILSGAGLARTVKVYALFAVVLGAFLVFRTPRSGYVMEKNQDFFSEVREKVPWLQFRVSPDYPLPEGVDNSQEPMPWGRVYREPKARVLTMSSVFGSYLRLLFWPHPLQGDYSPPPLDSPFSPSVWLSWGVWGGLLLAAWKLRHARPVLSFALLWLPFTLLPVSGLISLLNLQAERYLFIPSAGASLFLAGVIAELHGLRTRYVRAAAVGLGAALLCFFAALTVLRNRDYRDERVYYAATLSVDPSVGRSHLNLAGINQLEGRPAAADGAYRRAFQYWPQSVRGRNQYALFLVTQGKPEAALVQLQTALRFEAENPWLRFNLGIVYQRLKRYEQALVQFRVAMDLDPESPVAFLAAGQVFLDMGRNAEAAAHFRKALSISGWKSERGLYGLARAEKALGNAKEARRVRDLLRRSSPALADRIVLP